MRRFILLLLCSFYFITMSAQSTIYNAGFEDWTIDGTDTIPDHWIVNSFGNGRTTASHSGNYAAAVWNWYWYAQSILSNGYGTWMQGTKPGTPCTEKPLYLSGYYRYDTTFSSSTTDSGMVEVALTKYNGLSGERDTVGSGVLKLGPASDYQGFQVTINNLMPGIDPDTIIITFTSCVGSSCFCSMGSTGNCLYLYIDDLSLVTTTGVKPIGSLFNKVNATPNPMSVSSRIQLNNDGAETNITLYDALGRRIKGWNTITTETFTLYREDLPAGIYHMVINARDKVPQRLKLAIE